MEVFRDVLNKDHLERNDLELIIHHIKVYEDHLEIQLQADVDAILQSATEENTVNFKLGIENIVPCRLVQQASRRKDMQSARGTSQFRATDTMNAGGGNSL